MDPFPGGTRRGERSPARRHGRPSRGPIGDRTRSRVHAKLTAPRAEEGEEEGRWWTPEGSWPASLLAGCHVVAAWPWRGRPGRAVRAGAATTQHQRRDPLPGRPGHHPVLVGPLRLVLDRVQADPVESGDAGPASASQTVALGNRAPSPSSSSAASPTSRATPTASRAWPASAPPRRPRPPASGSSSRPTTRPSLRSWRACAPRHCQGAGAQGPAHPRARPHARRSAVDAIEGTRPSARSPSTSCSTSAPREPTFPSRRTQLNAKGKHTDAEHIIYSNWGEQVRPEAPKADHLRRLDKRRLRKRPDDRELTCGGRGKMSDSRPLAKSALAAPPCRASRRVKVMHPLRHSYRPHRRGRRRLAAAAALVLAAAPAPAGAASTTTTTTSAGSSAATTKYNAALKAVGTKGVHFSRSPSRTAPRSTSPVTPADLGRADPDGEEQQGSRST